MKRIKTFLPIMMGIGLLSLVVWARPTRPTASLTHSNSRPQQDIHPKESGITGDLPHAKVESTTLGRTMPPSSPLHDDRRKALIEVASRLKAGEAPPPFTWEPNEEEVKFLVATLTQP